MTNPLHKFQAWLDEEIRRASASLDGAVTFEDVSRRSVEHSVLERVSNKLRAYQAECAAAATLADAPMVPLHEVQRMHNYFSDSLDQMREIEEPGEHDLGQIEELEGAHEWTADIIKRYGGLT